MRSLRHASVLFYMMMGFCSTACADDESSGGATAYQVLGVQETLSALQMAPKHGGHGMSIGLWCAHT